MRLASKRLALIVAVGLTTASAATAADAHGCGRRALRDGDALRHLAFNRALVGGRQGCVEKDKVSVEEHRARRAARGGFFDIHGRYQH